LGLSKPEAVLLPPQEGATPFKAEFLYYRIYTENGAIPSKCPINSSDLSLGRINIDVITPPHTIDSIKRCIAKAEQLRPRKAANSKLFRNMESETPMDPAKVSALGRGDRLGLSEEDPIVYVHSHSMGVEYRYRYRYRYRVKQTAPWRSQAHGPGYAEWLDITSGEILYTERENTVATVQIYDWCFFDAYMLTNEAGASGYVNASYVVKL